MDNINEYINKVSLQNENANSGRSLSGLKSHIAHSILAEDLLNKSPAGDYHRKGFLYFHDLSGGEYSPYCYGSDLLNLITKGICNPIGGSSNPAKHFDVIIDHVVNYFYISQNEWEGAQAFSNFDTLIAPFIYYDNLNYDQVKQGMQRMIYNLSYPLRASYQSVFSNLSFDLKCPEHMKNEPAIIGGVSQERSLSEFQKEMDMLNLAFLEVMLEGDKNGRPHTFPISTYSITPDFDWDSKVTNRLFKLTAKFGLPYFMNYCLVRETPIIKMCDNGEIKRTNLLTIKPGQKIWTPEGFCNVLERHDIKVNKTIQFKFSNGSNVTCTPEHQFPTNEGLKNANDININDLIEVNNEYYDTNNGSFDYGRFLGLYIAEGWHDKTQTNFPNKNIELINFYKEFSENVFCAHVNERIRDDVIVLTINSKSIVGFINDFTFGHNAYNKKLNNKIFNMSKEFRRGVLVGWLEGGGHLMNDGSSMSGQLIRDMHDLASSIGIQTSMSLPIGNNQSQNKFSNLRILAPSFDWLDNKPKGDINASKSIFERNGKYYIKIISKKIDNKEKNVIDIKIDNKSHIFTLANGILTHNCGSGLDPATVRSMCCRLSLSLNEIIDTSKGGIWNSGINTGSLGVVTINLPLLGYMTKKYEFRYYDDILKVFNSQFDILLDKAKEHLIYKREKINEGFKIGLMPFTKSYLKDFSTFFSTIGIIGMHECCMNLFNKPIYKCTEFVNDVLQHLNVKTKEFTKETGYPWNLEQSPAEGASHKMAILDKKNYPDIYVSGLNGNYYYTNSSHINVADGLSLGESLKIQQEFNKHYTGGTLFHIFAGEGSPNPNGVKDLIKNICNRSSIPYIAFTKAYSICPNCGLGDDLSGICPKCQEITDVYDRVTGYYQPVRKFNNGKKEEFKNRQRFF
jgi:ribonucleoside-triphosphate reductase